MKVQGSCGGTVILLKTQPLFIFFLHHPQYVGFCLHACCLKVTKWVLSLQVSQPYSKQKERHMFPSLTSLSKLPPWALSIPLPHPILILNHYLEFSCFLAC